MPDLSGRWWRWVPAAVLTGGCALNAVLVAHQSGPVPLRAPIESVAPSALGAVGKNIVVSEDERKVAGMSSYLLREYQPARYPVFNVYVGYYDEQRQGKTIHSPKNCLPGAGWEPVDNRPMVIPTPSGPITVNRYELVRDDATAIAYYWYQGRGRVAFDEFRVKYDLLRDAVLRGRTEEALVRIFVPVKRGDAAAADRLALAEVPALAADVNRILPTP